MTKRKLHTHCIFDDSDKGKRTKHSVEAKHKNPASNLRHRREVKFYNAFGGHNYNF